jgi:2-polyprenyl-3-methyl-5-hydroxy-6-metoxy-1,4-benzoquinol methylase
MKVARTVLMGRKFRKESTYPYCEESIERDYFQKARNPAYLILSLPYINENEKVLDFGCGTLTVAEEIAQTKSVQVEGVDVINFNTEHLV